MRSLLHLSVGFWTGANGPRGQEISGSLTFWMGLPSCAMKYGKSGGAKVPIGVRVIHG